VCVRPDSRTFADMFSFHKGGGVFEGAHTDRNVDYNRRAP
jgi:hypothetical protein